MVADWLPLAANAVLPFDPRPEAICVYRRGGKYGARVLRRDAVEGSRADSVATQVTTHLDESDLDYLDRDCGDDIVTMYAGSPVDFRPSNFLAIELEGVPGEVLLAGRDTALLPPRRVESRDVRGERKSAAVGLVELIYLDSAQVMPR